MRRQVLSGGFLGARHPESMWSAHRSPLLLHAWDIELFWVSVPVHLMVNVREQPHWSKMIVRSSINSVSERGSMRNVFSPLVAFLLELYAWVVFLFLMYLYLHILLLLLFSCVIPEPKGQYEGNKQSNPNQYQETFSVHCCDKCVDLQYILWTFSKHSHTKHSLYIVLTSALICKQIFADVFMLEYIWRSYFLFAWRTVFRGSSMSSVDSVARVKVMRAQRMSTNGSFFDHPIMFDLLVRKVSTGTWNK